MSGAGASIFPWAWKNFLNSLCASPFFLDTMSATYRPSLVTTAPSVRGTCSGSYSSKVPCRASTCRCRDSIRAAASALSFSFTTAISSAVPASA